MCKFTSHSKTGNNVTRAVQQDPDPKKPNDLEQSEPKPSRSEQCGGQQRVCVKKNWYWSVKWQLSLFENWLDQFDWKHCRSPHSLTVSYVLRLFPLIFAKYDGDLNISAKISPMSGGDLNKSGKISLKLVRSWSDLAIPHRAWYINNPLYLKQLWLIWPKELQSFGGWFWLNRWSMTSLKFQHPSGWMVGLP